MRNSTPAADSADSISTKSRFNPAPLLDGPRLPRELPHHRHALARTESSDVVVGALVLQPKLAHRVARTVGRGHLGSLAEATGVGSPSAIGRSRLCGPFARDGAARARDRPRSHLSAAGAADSAQPERLERRLTIAQPIEPAAHLEPYARRFSGR